MSTIRRKGLIASLAGTAALLALAPSALAKVYHPNKTGDTVPNGCTSSDCTLREAIISANASTVSDKIILRARRTYKLAIAPVNSQDQQTGDLDIFGGGLTIQSDSADRLAKVNGKGVDRVFQIGNVATSVATKTKFKLLQIRGGRSLSDGGGIQVRSNASLRISKSEVTGNRALGTFGGGIDVFQGTFPASLNMRDSTVSRNVSGAVGGGLDASSGNLTLTNSTIADNSTGSLGGGVFLGLDSTNVAKLTNVTVARNTANPDGVGIGFGGGIWRGDQTGAATVRNSIVALNTVPGAGSLGPDCFTGNAALTSAGINLFSSLAGCNGFAVPPNIVTKNSKLGKLADNGGPTKTIALKNASKAIGSAGAGSTKRDQRGVLRTTPDIGAFERR